MSLPRIRTGYDAVAEIYADRFRDELDRLPLDRALLGAFAELVSGTVADVGCGPGRVTAYLTSLGVTALGMDLSPSMIARARKDHPDLRFSVGSMTDLDFADLGGILAWYSIIHTPPERLPAIFTEFHRVLAAGGYALLAFQTCDGPLPVEFDHTVTLAWEYPLDFVAGLLRESGFTEVARLRREPDETERLPRGHLLVRKLT